MKPTETQTAPATPPAALGKTPLTDAFFNCSDCGSPAGCYRFARDLEQRIAAATERLEARPIESAPKDGTYILIYRTHREAWCIAKWDADEYAKKPRPFWNSHSVWGVSGDRAATPTHWMPLPTRPALQPREQG